MPHRDDKGSYGIMPNYIRAKFKGAYYFFTVVTYHRVKLFNKEYARRCLREAIHKTQSKRPYETIAFCLLPDHLHCVWKLPQGDAVGCALHTFFCLSFICLEH